MKTLTKLTAIAIAVLATLSLLSSPAHAATPPLNTAVVRGSAGLASAKVYLKRYDPATGKWVTEKSGSTNSSGGFTFRSVRGGATYTWVAVASAYDYYSQTPCYFFTYGRNAYVARGANVAIGFSWSMNTCGV